MVYHTNFRDVVKYYFNSIKNYLPKNYKTAKKPNKSKNNKFPVKSHNDVFYLINWLYPKGF